MTRSGSFRIVVFGTLTSRTWTELPTASSLTSMSIASGMSRGRHSTESSRSTSCRIPLVLAHPGGRALQADRHHQVQLLAGVDHEQVQVQDLGPGRVVLDLADQRRDRAGPLDLESRIVVSTRVVASSRSSSCRSTLSARGSSPWPYATAGTIPALRSFRAAFFPRSWRGLAVNVVAIVYPL
jgi:hypothetical protein